MATMRWLAIVSLLFATTGCSDKPADGDTNSGDNNKPTNSEVACIQCGPANLCGTACDDPCGCCCTEGDERVRDGDVQRCTPESCWEVVGPVVDAGDDAGADDAGDDAGDDTTEDAGTDASVTACTEQPNEGSSPADTCQHGAADWIVWKWVASADMTVDQIALHTSSEGSGALLDDSSGSPGDTLFSGALSAADADGWRSFTADAPVGITAGTTYWIGEKVTVCSTVMEGTEFDYYTADVLAGPWSGPFNAHPFTARVSGTCP